MIPASILYQHGFLKLNIPIVLLVGELHEVIEQMKSKQIPAIFYAMKTCPTELLERVENGIKQIILDSLLFEAPPAGYVRGCLPDLKMEVSPGQYWTRAELEALYEKGINPIKTSRQTDGTFNFVWGTKFVADDGSIGRITDSLGSGISTLFMPYLDVEQSDTALSIKNLKEKFEYRLMDSDFVQEAHFVMTGIKSEMLYMENNRIFDGPKTVELHKAKEFMTVLFNQCGIQVD